MSDIDTVVVDSLKALDPEWPIREADILLIPAASSARQLVHKLWPQVLDQLAHRIGDGFDALEFEDFLVYPLDFVGGYHPPVEVQRWQHQRRMLPCVELLFYYSHIPALIAPHAANLVRGANAEVEVRHQLDEDLGSAR